MLAYRAAMDGASHKEVVDLADHGLDDGRSLTAETDGLPLPFAMRLLGWIDELDRADRVHQSLLAAAREGSIVAFAIAAVCAASTAMRRGQLAVAEAEGRTATALSVQHDLKFYEPFARALLGEALLEQGELDQAAAALGGIDLEPIRGSGPSGLLLYVRGRLRAARADRDGAACDLRECGEIYEAMGYRNPNILPWRSVLAALLPDPAEARLLAGTELARARQAGQPRGIGIALRAGALLGDRDERIPLLREAAETLSRSPSALELARTLTDYGTALARSGQRASAREPSGKRWTWPPGAGHSRSRDGPARNSAPSAPGPAANASPGSRASPPASSAWPDWLLRASPTVRSPRRCSSAPRQSALIWATSTTS